MRYMRQRVLAGILAAALLSGQAGITAVSAGTDSGTAESADFSGHETVSVAGFAELSEEEARQTVPVGTQKEDLPLPEELPESESFLPLLPTGLRAFAVYIQVPYFRSSRPVLHRESKYI